MNMFKKNGGFTLVELIVVIAILAILAGVAVPVYSGYISKANEAADYTALDAVKTAAAFAFTEKQVAAGETDVSIAKIVVASTGVTVTNDSNKSVTLSVDDMKVYTAFPVTFKTADITGATWLKTAADSLEAGWNLTK